MPLFVCSDAVCAYDLCAARSDDTHTRTAKGHCCSWVEHPPPKPPICLNHLLQNFQELHANCTQHANRAKWSRMEMTRECHSCVPFRGPACAIVLSQAPYPALGTRSP